VPKYVVEIVSVVVAAIAIVKVASAVRPLLSAASTAKVSVVAPLLGVPEIIPVELASDNPVGKLPDAILHI
jgi:hypothetical protein